MNRNPEGLDEPLGGRAIADHLAKEGGPGRVMADDYPVAYAMRKDS